MKTRWLFAYGCMLALSARAQDAMPDMALPAPGNVPATTRSPDYSDGYRYGPMPGMDMPDESAQGMLMLDQLEYAHDNHGGDAGFVDGEAWYGKDFDKLWLKFEGEYAHGAFDDVRMEALWDHAVAPFRDTQLGIRHDAGAGPGRTWAAFGVQGLAPYRVETEATLYLGADGRTAARAQFEYEAAITQRLVLQPKLEFDLYGRDDPQRGIGSGLSDAAFGLRLHYEITRQFAPYAGVAWQQRFGRSADFARVRGGRAQAWQFVVGVRAWF